MHFIWIPVTLCCALSLATSDALTKKALAERYNEYLVAWFRLLLVLPLLFILLLAVPLPRTGAGFAGTILVAIPIELLALILYVKALKLSPLGLTVPFLALTPLVLLVLPFLLLGERITPAGGAGVLLIAAGCYVLNVQSGGSGLMAPYRAILREPGSLCMIGVAILYSFAAVLTKKAITDSSPLFFAGLYPILLFICLTPIALWKGRHDLRHHGGAGLVRATLLPSLCTFGEILFGVIALSLTNVAYMIAVKRMSLLFGIIYGHFLFREERFRQHFAGGVLMVAGVALIVAGGS